jgi:hypothetical protein
MLDPVAVERAEKSINEFINARSKAKKKANEEEELWKASERLHKEKLREENRSEWISFFDRMAQCHARIAEDYERRAEALYDKILEKGTK